MNTVTEQKSFCAQLSLVAHCSQPWPLPPSGAASRFSDRSDGSLSSELWRNPNWILQDETRVVVWCKSQVFSSRHTQELWSLVLLSCQSWGWKWVGMMRWHQRECSKAKGTKIPPHRADFPRTQITCNTSQVPPGNFFHNSGMPTKWCIEHNSIYKKIICV